MLLSNIARTCKLPLQFPSSLEVPWHSPLLPFCVVTPIWWPLLDLSCKWLLLYPYSNPTMQTCQIGMHINLTVCYCHLVVIYFILDQTPYAFKFTAKRNQPGLTFCSPGVLKLMGSYDKSIQISCQLIEINCKWSNLGGGKRSLWTRNYQGSFLENVEIELSSEMTK